MPGISKKQIRSLYIFWTGFALYTLGYVLSHDDFFVIGPSILQAAQSTGLVLILFGAYPFMKFKFDDKYLKTVFILFFLFSLTVVARGFKTDFVFIKKMLFNPYYGMLHYFVPLVVLLPRDFKHYKIIFNFLAVFAFMGFFLILLYFNVLLDWDWRNDFGKGLTEILFQALALPVGFILLTFAYHTKKKNWLAFLLTIITIYFLIHRARRGSLFIESITLLSAGLVYLVYTKRKSLAIALLVVLLPIVTIMGTGIKLPAMFDSLIARGTEDTRTEVEQYMSVSMSTVDWIIGKGITGDYYCPVVINMETLNYQRDVIETGYLQIALKGGYTSLILLFMILLPAVYKAFFDSKNILTRSAGILILLWIISLRPMVSNGFTMEYILVWISVGICYSKKIRYLSDNTIKEHLKGK